MKKGGFFVKITEIKRGRGGVLSYAAQETSLVDDEIGKKGPFRMETS